MVQTRKLEKAMDARDHFKNGASSKNLMSRVIFKNISKVFIAILCVTQFSFVKAQEITEENYKKMEALIQEEFNQEVAELSEYAQKHPENMDSILNTFEHLLDNFYKKSADNLIKFSSIFEVPKFLEQLYALRISTPKDTIRSVLKTIPENMQSSPYVKSLLYHIETEQIKVGSKYYDFQAIGTDGESFTLSSLEGKNILLLYGGLDCMGEGGRNNLSKLNGEINSDNFKIVVFCGKSSDLESLQQERTKYAQSLPFDYYLVSDYLGDHSSMKILYGPQATPTTFLINQKGLVVMKTTGFSYEQVLQFYKKL